MADEKTLEAIIANRYEVMAVYARQMRATVQAELDAMKAKRADVSMLEAARRWLHRDDDKVHAMREELRQLWSNTHVTREQLAKDLQAWCRRAEESGIAALREYSIRLRAVRAA